jgi:hypothetical protein
MAPDGVWGINVRCLEDVDLDTLEVTKVYGSKLV